ncbi:MAG TPA: hypothetical protein VGI58_06575 [Streptosporangiaceae bacterium]|jgi:hypothetical protein
MTSQATTGGRAGTRHRTVRNLSVLAGIGYAVAWLVSLSVGAPNLSVAASGRKVLAAYGGHGWSAMTMFVLAEGIAAIALAIIVVLAAGAARRQGTPRAGLSAAGFGLAAAVVSWVELGMGAWLTFSVVPSGRAANAGTLNNAITRIDGGKMLLLAAMAVALAALAAKSTVLPRWLAPLGLLLAVALVASGLGWVLLTNGLATSVYVSGALLIVFVAATGVTMGRRAGAAEAHAGRRHGSAASR